MVIKGKARGNGKQLANYLMTKGENENVRVMDIRGTSQPDNIHRSLLEMSLSSELSKTDKGLYHAQINPGYGEDKAMTHEDWLKAADELEQELKLTGQKRVIVLHEKKDRLHAHVVWERFDHEKGRMIEDSYNHYKHDRARHTLEKELGHKRTPKRNLQQPEMKKELTKLWHEHKKGADFIKAAKEKGYVVGTAHGRRPYIVADQKGITSELRRSLDKVKTGELRERFKEVKLPTEKKAIIEARSLQSEKKLDTAQEKFIDYVEMAKAERAAKRDQRRMFRDKKNEMAKEADQVTGSNVTKAQKRFQQKMDDAKEKSTNRDGVTYEQQKAKVNFTFDKASEASKQQRENAIDATGDENINQQPEQTKRPITDMQRENQEDMNTTTQQDGDRTGQFQDNSNEIRRKDKDRDFEMD
jgi:hypothetical protein